MKLRYAAPFAAAALALGVAAPVASAQSDLDSGSLDAGSIADGSLGDFDSESLEGALDADEDAECVLPDLGGSVDEMSGSIAAISGVPSGAISSVSGSLGSLDNPLVLLGFDEYLAETGSLEGALCGVLGGEMIDPNEEEEETDGSLGDLGSGSGSGSGSAS